MIVAIIYIQACLLPPLLPSFPCALLLFLHVLGSAVATSVTTARAMVFVIESQYSLMATAATAVVGHRDTASTASTVSVKDEEHSIIEGFGHVVREVLRVGFGFRDISTLSLETLNQIRRAYLLIFLVISIPPFVVFAIGVLSVPAYRGGCTDCGVTVEFLIIVLTSPTIFLVFISRMIMIGRKYRQDEQEVMREIFITLLLAPHWIYIGYILDIVDPNHVSYNRTFSWEILTCIGPFLFWAIVVALQVYLAVHYRIVRGIRTRARKSETKSYVDEVSADENLKRDFYQFAAARYAIELLKFVDDVRAYKNRFEEQPDKWHRTKAKQIVNTYIRHGSPQEVNISAMQRERITRVDLDKSTVLFNLFDEALSEITLMVNTGLWIDFKNQKLKRPSRNMVVASSVL